ncbi:uncharacterized protein LOC135926336 isoform X2 [Gordionus sp. m RMFG-2023]|uniref:uncharacterized protein LOC135926336 isoform X2 n=1 Tax=Gordionus sp. m RMFG-2023 TaxID=3053472 RepID=UPI0031FC4C3D
MVELQIIYREIPKTICGIDSSTRCVDLLNFLSSKLYIKHRRLSLYIHIKKNNQSPEKIIILPIYVKILEVRDFIKNKCSINNFLFKIMENNIYSNHNSPRSFSVTNRNSKTINISPSNSQSSEKSQANFVCITQDNLYDLLSMQMEKFNNNLEKNVSYSNDNISDKEQLIYCVLQQYFFLIILLTLNYDILSKPHKFTNLETMKNIQYLLQSQNKNLLNIYLDNQNKSHLQQEIQDHNMEIRILTKSSFELDTQLPKENLQNWRDKISAKEQCIKSQTKYLEELENLISKAQTDLTKYSEFNFANTLLPKGLLNTSKSSSILSNLDISLFTHFAQFFCS